MVSLSAAQIHDESKKLANIIRGIPYNAFDAEVYTHRFDSMQFGNFDISSLIFFKANRFLEQVVNTKVGLTGMRFFYFTRPLILSVIGTIITYELVLVQFQVTTPKTKENMC